MNKKLVSLAVAAALAAPVAALADATMYGKMHLSIDNVSIDNFANWGGSHRDITVVNRHSGLQPLGGVIAAYEGTLAMDSPAYQQAFFDVVADPANAGVDPRLLAIEAARAGTMAAEASADPVDAQAVATASINAYDAGAGYGFSGWDVTSQPGASRFGIKGSEDLGGGMKAIYQVELGIDPAEGGLSTTLRNTFVGLAGNFGTFLLGRHDTPLKISTGKLDMFVDTLADYNLTVGFDDVRASNVIAYISPSFSGFQLAAATVAPGDELDTYVDLDGNIRRPKADGLAEAWSIAGIYKNGPFYGSVAYERFNDDLFSGQNEDYELIFGKTADDYNKWRVGLGLLDWNGFTLSGVYENQSAVRGAPSSADSKLWQIQAGYAFGNNMIKGMYGQMDLEKCTDPGGYGFRFTCTRGNLAVANNQDKDTWALGFDHSFSKRTKVYALYTQLNDDASDADWSGFSMGMIHKF